MLSTGSRAALLLLLGRLRADCPLHRLPSSVIREVVALLWPALPSHHVMAWDPEQRACLVPARLGLPRAPADGPWHAPLEGGVDAGLVGDTAGAFTVEAWVQIKSLAHAGFMNPIVGRQGPGISGWELRTRPAQPSRNLMRTPMHVVCLLVAPEQGNKIVSRAVPGAMVVPCGPGRWVHVAGVWDGRAARAYQSGALVSEEELAGPDEPPLQLRQAPPDTPLCAAYNQHHRLLGRVAELCVTPAALSPTSFRLL